MNPAWSSATKSAILAFLECRGIEEQDKDAATKALSEREGGKALARFYLNYIWVGGKEGG